MSILNDRDCVAAALRGIDGFRPEHAEALCAALQVIGAALALEVPLPRTVRRAAYEASDRQLLAAWRLSLGSGWHEHFLRGYALVQIARGNPPAAGLPESN